MNQEFIIVAVLPEPFRTELAQLRQTYDRWTTNALPPHITIVRPLRALPAKLQQRLSSLRYPFRITFQDWQAFRNPGAYVIWVDPGQEEARRVAQALYQDFPELQALDNGRYMPGKSHIYHVTVVSHIPNDQFKSVWENIRQQRISGSCDIEQLSVYVRDLPEGHWKPAE